MKILIKEEQQNRLKLPPFIYKAIISKNTSLGDNPALPPYGDFGLEYDVVKHKFEEVDNRINKFIDNGELESKDCDYLISILSKKIEQCKKIEKALSPQLEKLCENIVNALFSVPEDTVLFKCKLVGKIKPKNSMRILPEGEGAENEYDFEDIDEVELTNKVILKRRFINSLIQGISYWLSTDIDNWYNIVNILNNDLWNLWFQIIYITDYLLFVKEEKISEKNPMQMSYVEVHLGKKGRKTLIESQGIIFPYMLRESIRGFLELFSSHGLPEDSKKAMYIIRKADFIVAEPWDLRLGMGIVDLLKNNLTEKYQTGLFFNTNRIPFFFTELCSLSTDEFNSVMKNFIIGTKKGKLIAKKMDSDIVHDLEYQEFKDKIQQKNINTSLISDGDFSKEELDNYVIQENEEDEATLYHGTPHDFEKFDLAYLSTGFGQQSHGYGVYLTTSENTAKAYSQGKFIYTVEVPDGKYLNNKKINKKEALNITKKFFKYYTTEDEYGKEAYKGYENEFWQEECKYIADCEDGASVYGTIASLIGSDKQTSAFLHRIGYVGLMIYCTNGETSEKFINYVIFDANDVEIKEKKALPNSQISENLENEITAYHGTGADFDKFNHKKYLNTGVGSQAFGWGTYVTNDEVVAKGYSDASKKHNLSFRKIVPILINEYGYDEESAEQEAGYIISNVSDSESLEEYLRLGEFSKSPINKRRYNVVKKIASLDSFLYEVNIPDDNGTNYIEWYKHFPKEQMKKVLCNFLDIHDNHLNQMAKRDYPFRCELYQSIQFMKQNPDKVEEMIEILTNNERYDTFFSTMTVNNGFYVTNYDTEGKNVYRRLEQIMGSDKAVSLFLLHCGFDGIKYPSGTRWRKPDGASEDAMNYVIFDSNKVKIINKTKV